MVNRANKVKQVLHYQRLVVPDEWPARGEEVPVCVGCIP